MTDRAKINQGGRYVVAKGGKPQDAKRVPAVLEGGAANPAHHEYPKPAKPAEPNAQAATPADNSPPAVVAAPGQNGEGAKTATTKK